jgi:predicted nucleic acid-binding protein
MMLLDSNIIIYSADPAQSALREFIVRNQPAVSAVSFVEVLGFHSLTAADRTVFEAFFAAAGVLPVSPVVIDRAVSLRQARKMGLGDSLVAATALVFGRELVTRNVKDFAWIEGLTLLNPFPDG